MPYNASPITISNYNFPRGGKVHATLKDAPFTKSIHYTQFTNTLMREQLSHPCALEYAKCTLQRQDPK